jgi:HEAT repeat protein
VTVSRSTIQDLVAQLDSPDEGVARRVSEELNRIFYPQCPSVMSGDQIGPIHDAHYSKWSGSDLLEPLRQALTGGSVFARAYAATILGGAVRDRRAIPLLIAALRDPSSEVRVAVAKGWEYFREPLILPALIEALQDSETEVRQWAASALGSTGLTEVVSHLTAFFERSKEEDKIAALNALGRISDPASLPLMRDALHHPHRQLREAAKAALRRYHFKHRKQL